MNAVEIKRRIVIQSDKRSLEYDAALRALQNKHADVSHGVQSGPLGAEYTNLMLARYRDTFRDIMEIWWEDLLRTDTATLLGVQRIEEQLKAHHRVAPQHFQVALNAHHFVSTRIPPKNKPFYVQQFTSGIDRILRDTMNDLQTKYYNHHNPTPQERAQMAVSQPPVINNNNTTIIKNSFFSRIHTGSTEAIRTVKEHPVVSLLISIAAGVLIWGIQLLAAKH